MERQKITVTVADRGRTVRVQGWIHGSDYGIEGSPLEPTGLDDDGRPVVLSTSAQLRAYCAIEAQAERR